MLPWNRNAGQGTLPGMNATTPSHSTDMTAIVLAAGKGTRMQSDLPKVLHRLHDTPLVLYPMRAATEAGATRIILVVGHGGELVRAAVCAAELGDAKIRFAEQHEQLGTGHAVLCALGELDDATGPVWILSGDVPMVRAQTLDRLRDAWRQSGGGLALAIFRPDDAHGYGRILRDTAGDVVGIVEQRDASPAELDIEECNAGIYCIDLELLRDELPRLGRSNQHGEIYLTDLVALASRRGGVADVTVDPIEAAGVNTVQQLEQLEQQSP
jgi:UDP-N-acetylglucosamine diphosphorylase/glucosamine-1-phosphate N-acetyltransferase